MSTVAELRAAAGISQAELARRSGVAQPNIAAYETGRRRPSPQMLDRLRDAVRPRPSELLKHHRAEVLAILSGHGLTSARVFGSVARGDDTPGSDIDLVVEIGRDGDVLDLIDAADELEQLLGCAVDLVTARALWSGHEIDRTSVPL
ncbi:helix-turn-helix domain-containing protein [Yimella sp. NH-Cas1]|uniref:helix-turn-helix domain-containing protein n=1 Tax=Yimella sp. NH-Cas1 TaxID=2917726 RepID=UPI001EFB7296|nr:helix-turn-helix domain-containing protein [Yimella sp. NH-Cas1]MCG8654065.1 helix-turn-helix domain-containing protein [Yimella sp. NH-Cas1]